MGARRLGWGDRLPDFPWDTIAAAKRRAEAHPGGLVDLSVGTPVDPLPVLGQEALARAADAPGYPLTVGDGALREAMVAHLRERWHAPRGVGALPVIGTKELVAGLAAQLGVAAGSRVVLPRVAYPTYAVGAALAGAEVVLADHPDEIGADAVDEVSLVWLNSPSNPSGRTWSPETLRTWVRWCRDHGVVLASDECYGEFGWEVEPVSVLDPQVSEGEVTGLLALHSLSKRSNAAGYRAGLVGGDPALVDELALVRKHAGLIVPAPVQAAMVALLDDTAHVTAQRERYAARRARLRTALEAAGARIDFSEAGLYLWTTFARPARETLDWFAERGILVAPGDFYGTEGAEHVRIALTATDERIDAAVERLA